MKATTSEAEIQRQLIAYLRLIGGHVVRVNSGAAKVGKRLIRFTDTPGTPDILFALPHPECGGRAVFCACEVKRPGGKLRPSQAEQIDAIRRAGGLAFVADGLDTLRAALRLEGFDTP